MKTIANALWQIYYAWGNRDVQSAAQRARLTLCTLQVLRLDHFEDS